MHKFVNAHLQMRKNKKKVEVSAATENYPAYEKNIPSSKNIPVGFFKPNSASVVQPTYQGVSEVLNQLYQKRSSAFPQGHGT